MRPKHYQSPNDISNYVETLLNLQDDKELNNVLEYARAFGTPPLQITHFDARHIEVLVRLVKPKKILEFGTLCGYSTVVLARALEQDGIVYTCEKSPHHAQSAITIFDACKLSQKIKVIEGDALTQLPKLANYAPYDVIFIDSKKEDYPELFEWCVTHLKNGGLLIADNVFALGFIHKDENELSDKLKCIVNKMKKFNSLCANDKRLRTTLFPTGEGLLVAIKIASS